ncbi:hypothetical protein L596_012975 [Steinernema carpocapsae]|uniref:Fungal lipase-type domain-containing protein n=1 Tax=Steinernema carpocapsae TaxID=34508 RepID=A0A4U5NYV5_STECR|nr:hypothetical protein L596_012975 [Steinernema carpocapsae]
MVEPLVEEGITVAVVGYDLATKRPLREVVDQVKRAVKFIVDYFPYVEITIGGHSAGGHLASLALSELPEIDRISTLVSICGVYELDDIVHTYIGRLIHLTSEMARNCSLDAAKLVQKFGDKPIVFLKSEFDAPRLKQQNLDLEGVLRSLGAKDLRSVEIPNVDHFSIIENLRFKNHSATRTLIEALGR